MQLILLLNTAVVETVHNRSVKILSTALAFGCCIHTLTHTCPPTHARALHTLTHTYVHCTHSHTLSPTHARALHTQSHTLSDIHTYPHARALQSTDRSDPSALMEGVKLTFTAALPGLFPQTACFNRGVIAKHLRIACPQDKVQ